MSELSQPRIVSAAMRFDSGEIICSPRHFDFLCREQLKLIPNWKEKGRAKQGFVDQHCRFYDRRDAWTIAKRNGQIIRDCGNASVGILYSENLY